MDIKVNENTVIVFDLDDTLYNELDYLKSAYQEIAQYLASKDWKALYSVMFSLYRNKKNVFEFLCSKYSIEKSTLIDKYRNHKPNIQLFEGVIEIIKSTKIKGGKIGIITDGRTRTQMAKLKALGILDYIDHIVISEAIGSEKPDQANFKAIEDKFPNCTYWYLADNLKKDFVAPNAMEWLSIGIIDNGKNIHYQSSNYMEETHRPIYFLVDYNELSIV